MRVHRISLRLHVGATPDAACARHMDQAGAKVTVQQEATQGIVLTDGAAAKVSSLLTQEGRDDLKLRIAVQPGGCSGLRYQLYFDERDIDGDIVSEFGGFTIDNPNATGSCACGDSFH
jgi:Fe-S cluster assembly iron-binding protein IscA